MEGYFTLQTIFFVWEYQTSYLIIVRGSYKLFMIDLATYKHIVELVYWKWYADLLIWLKENHLTFSMILDFQRIERRWGRCMVVTRILVMVSSYKKSRYWGVVANLLRI